MMQLGNEIRSDELGAQSLASADRSDQVVSETLHSTPLLADDQIAKLQKILRSMDHVQLQSVLAALEPNVLRLCLHAIFGSSTAREKDLSEPETNSTQTNSAPPTAPQSTAPMKISETSPPVMFRRLNPRMSMEKNAKIYCPTGNINIDCLILDVSQSGALVFLDYAGELPETFDLYDIGDQKSADEFTHLPHKKCECVWRNRNKMGVRFAE